MWKVAGGRITRKTLQIILVFSSLSSPFLEDMAGELLNNTLNQSSTLMYTLSDASVKESGASVSH